MKNTFGWVFVFLCLFSQSIEFRAGANPSVKSYFYFSLVLYRTFLNSCLKLGLTGLLFWHVAVVICVQGQSSPKECDNIRRCLTQYPTCLKKKAWNVPQGQRPSQDFNLSHKQTHNVVTIAGKNCGCIISFLSRNSVCVSLHN